MAQYFVTGSSGFLGSKIVEALLARGEKNIVAFDILDPTTRLPHVRYVQGDILNRTLLHEVMKGTEYVFHNAALVPLTKAGTHFQTVNVMGTRNVAENCKLHKVKKMVHMSSSAIYGLPDDTPITEKTPYHAIEIYGQSKLDAEKEVWRYQEDGGSASCIRPRTIIGGTSRLGIFQILFEWISEGKHIYTIGDGKNLFQFVHVDDLIDATLKAGHAHHNGLYNIGSENYGTLGATLQELISYAGTGSRIRHLPVTAAKMALTLADVLHLSPLAPWHYLTYHKPFVFDISKAKRELQWAPRHSDRDAMRESYDWYMANKEHLAKEGRSPHSKPVSQRILKLLKFFS